MDEKEIMFKWFKDSPKTIAEQRIEAIVALLFPPIDVTTDGEGNKFHVDYSADANLEAALIDLEYGHNDQVTQNTIRKVADKLYEIRKMLDIYNELDEEAKYYVVDTDNQELEDRIRSPDDV